jgi:predicted ATPase
VFEGSTTDNFIEQRLVQRSVQAGMRVEEMVKSEAARTKATGRLTQFSDNLKIIDQTSSFIKATRDEIIDYLAEKKSQAISSVHGCFETAKNILPQAQEATMLIHDKTMKITTEDGLEMFDSDGCGNSSILSMLIRGVVLRNTQYQKIKFLDEPLSALSPETSVLFSYILPYLVQDMQLVLIEQKPEVFASITDCTTYHFTKVDKVTTVRKV